jgi:hypothetical protein
LGYFWSVVRPIASALPLIFVGRQFNLGAGIEDTLFHLCTHRHHFLESVLGCVHHANVSDASNTHGIEAHSAVSVRSRLGHDLFSFGKPGRKFNYSVNRGFLHGGSRLLGLLAWHHRLFQCC